MKKYENFSNHLRILSTASEQNLENAFIVSGIIDKFFIQFELGWKLCKIILKYEGDSVGATGSPREIIKAVYRYFDFMDEDVWLEMLKARNDMAHIYDGNAANRFVAEILARYIPEFANFEKGIFSLYGDGVQKF